MLILVELASKSRIESTFYHKLLEDAKVGNTGKNFTEDLHQAYRRKNSCRGI